MGSAKLDRKTVAELVLPDGKNEDYFWDTDLKGFGLKLKLDGQGKVRRSFVVQYRLPGGQQRRQKIADVTKVNADVARKRAAQMLAKVTLGIDPAAEKQKARAATAITLRSVIEDQYLPMKEREVATGRHRASSLAITRLYLLKDYFQPLHGKPINAITKADIATRLNAIIANNSANTASRARAHLSALFVWSMQQGLADANPCIGTKDPGSGPPRERVLNNDELARIWRACKDDEYGKIIRLLMLTGCRRSEIGGLRWSEIDLEQNTLTIPAERSKNYRAHTLPLTGMMRSIIESVPVMVDRDPLFGVRAEGFTLWQHCHLDDGCKPYKLHDIRRSVATGMADLGIMPHVIENVLNHVSGHKAGVAGIYNRSTGAREMKNALAVWSDHIASITSGSERKIVNFPAIK
jgi:integrase